MPNSQMLARALRFSRSGSKPILNWTSGMACTNGTTVETLQAEEVTRRRRNRSGIPLDLGSTTTTWKKKKPTTTTLLLRGQRLARDRPPSRRRSRSSTSKKWADACVCLECSTIGSVDGLSQPGVYLVSPRPSRQRTPPMGSGANHLWQVCAPR